MAKKILEVKPLSVEPLKLAVQKRKRAAVCREREPVDRFISEIVVY